MRWRKLGRVFLANGQRPWMQSHASMPFAESIGDNFVRIWFSTRNDQNRSHLAWLEIDITQPQYLLKLAEDPALAPGPAGRFDDSGTMGSWLIQNGTERWLYYIGWSQSGANPFHLGIGLAVSHDGGVAFSRHAPDPIMDRSAESPIFVSTPCVLAVGDTWHMWHLSATDWPQGANTPDYNIRHATSTDGLTWTPDAQPCIDFAQPNECAIARSSVLIEEDCWRMWYCYRGRDFPYRIGYAESADGQAWTRRDDAAGLSVSSEGWDSEMVAYPYVFDHEDRRYMLYAGNGFGRDGIGLAILEPE